MVSRSDLGELFVQAWCTWVTFPLPTPLEQASAWFVLADALLEAGHERLGRRVRSMTARRYRIQRSRRRFYDDALDFEIDALTYSLARLTGRTPWDECGEGAPDDTPEMDF